MIVPIILIIAGFSLLIYGAEFLVEGASNIAKKMRIPEIVIGLTIVSIGTSMPELMVSITSSMQGFQDIAIGNVIGSNISNLLLILGLSALIKPVTIQKDTQNFEIPLCIVATFVFGMMCATGTGISKFEAIILIVLFLVFIGYTIFLTRKSQGNTNIAPINHKDENTSLLKDIGIVLLGVVALKLGGDFTVDNATKIAQMFGWSEKLISITILAIGTSLPELVTSVVAAIKGNSDIAVRKYSGFEFV